MTSAASSMTVAESRRSVSKILALAIATGALLVPVVAHAEGPTAAEALFREGRTLLDAKRYDEACPKLAESQKLEPGAGTLLALALCHEGQGKPATASAELKRASELGRRVGRMDLASAADRRAAALEASVPHLVVHLPEGSAYRVRCDGEAIASSDLGAPVAMDPGEHRIEVAADGKMTRSYVVRISGSGTVEIVVDKLEDVPAAPAPVVVTRPAPRARTILASPEPLSDHVEHRGGAQRAVGLVLVGAGVVGLGAGAYFGGQALSQSGEANRACPTTAACPEGTDANDRAKDSFRVAVVSVASGAGALTLGTIIYFLAPSGPAPRGDAKPPRRTARVLPSAGPTGVSLGVSGTF